MKKLLFILFVCITLTSYAQIQVKEGSFKFVPGGVVEDKMEYTDGNDLPMALVKIHTENISEQERLRLVFSGNRATQIIKRPKIGQMWVYVSAEPATFIEIKHPDYGVCKYYLPEKLCDYCVYEMVLQYVPMSSDDDVVKPQNTYLIITTDQDDAVIYIDGKFAGIKETSKSFDIGTSHTWKIECNMYHTESDTLVLKDKTIIDKKLRPNFGYIDVVTYPENGAKVFVDGEYVGESPCKTGRLKSGEHSVKVMKEMYDSNEETFVVTDEQTTKAIVSMKVNFVTLTIFADKESDIYVDEEYKGKEVWSGRLAEGSHYIEARKKAHETSARNINLTLGKDEAIKLENPKPIYGFLDLNTTPIMADILIDGESYGQTPTVIDDLLVGEHELRLHKDGYSFFAKNINIDKGETLVMEETLVVGREVTIVTDVIGDTIYVDGFYVGVSPMKMNVSYGMHDFAAVRARKKLNKTINVTGALDKVRLMFDEVNGHEYVDLGLPSGLKWATCNVGADKPEDYGDYFAWGEVNTKKEFGYGSSYKKVNKKNISGDVRYDAARANWEGGWRIPTAEEFKELKDKCVWEWTTNKDKKGYKIIGPNGNSIFLPAAGNIYGKEVSFAENDGYYWSSMINDESYSDFIIYLSFSSYDYEISDYGSGNKGLSIRPVCSSVEYVDVVGYNYKDKFYEDEIYYGIFQEDEDYYDEYFEPIEIEFDSHSLSAFVGMAMGFHLDYAYASYGTDDNYVTQVVKAVGLEYGMYDAGDYKMFLNMMCYLPNNKRNAVSVILGASEMDLRYGVGFCYAKYYAPPSYVEEMSSIKNGFSVGCLLGYNYQTKNNSFLNMDCGMFLLGNHLFFDLRIGIGLKWDKKLYE